MFKTLFGKKLYGEITTEEAKKRLDSGGNIILLDVRTPEEYEGAHIPGSKSLPLDRLDSGISRIAPNKDTEMIVYCLSGVRAASACNYLTSIGYTNVSTMDGIRSWAYGLEK